MAEFTREMREARHEGPANAKYVKVHFRVRAPNGLSGRQVARSGMGHAIGSTRTLRRHHVRGMLGAIMGLYIVIENRLELDPNIVTA